MKTIFKDKNITKIKDFLFLSDGTTVVHYTKFGYEKNYVLLEDKEFGPFESVNLSVSLLGDQKRTIKDYYFIGRDFDGKTITNYYFAAKINYGDKQKIVFCRVKHPDGSVKRFYVDEVFTEDEIKKRDLPSSVSGNQDIRSKSLYRIILQDIYGVNNYLKNKEYFINKSNFGGN